MQRQIRPNEAVVEFVLDEPASYAFVLTRDKATLHALEGRKQIESAVAAHLAAIQNGTSIDRSGRTLNTLLFAPLASRFVSGSNLIIVPDASLHRLPFETLVDTHGTTLLDSHVISYTPSANVLALLRQHNERFPADQPLLAVSSSPQPPAAKPQGDVVAANLPSSGVKRGVFDADEPNLKPLPAANDEVRSVARSFAPSGVVLTGATESEFKAQDLSRFRVIHLAVHGLTSTKMPEHSALLFRPDAASQQDGFLQMREIGMLKLRADLVTLSACDTGNGKVNGQEGVANLVRPFLLAGAKSVLANLWEVDDNFSRGLMTKFYTQLASGKDEATSLTLAKRAMIHDFGEQATAVKGRVKRYQQGGAKGNHLAAELVSHTEGLVSAPSGAVSYSGLAGRLAFLALLSLSR